MLALLRGILVGLMLGVLTLTACQVKLPATPLTNVPSPTAPATLELSPPPGHGPAAAPWLSPTVVPAEAAVSRITAESLKAKLDAGEAVVIVDTRSLEHFRQKRIAGAVSMPLSEIDARYAELPKGKEIVLYCT